MYCPAFVVKGKGRPVEAAPFKQLSPRHFKVGDCLQLSPRYLSNLLRVATGKPRNGTFTLGCSPKPRKN